MSSRVVKRAKYKSSLKDPGTTGVLTMMETKFVFGPNNPTSAKLDVPFQLIKAQKNTKENSNKPPQPPWLNITTNTKDKSDILEFETYPDLHACREIIANAIEDAKSSSAAANEVCSTAELELRMKLMQEDSQVQKLHKQFVGGGGVLTDSEFWSTRNKKLLDIDSRRKSNMQQVGFKSSMILDIKPMSEKDLWTLSQDLNRQGAVVLQGRNLNGDTENPRQEYGDRITRMTEIEDLRGPQDPHVAPLCIKDPRDYFDTQQGSALQALYHSRTGTEEAYGSLKESISKIRSIELSNATVEPEVALTVFNISSTKYQLGKNSMESSSILDGLPNRTREELLHHWMSIQELLRHFWRKLWSQTSGTRSPSLFVQCIRLLMLLFSIMIQTYRKELQGLRNGNV